MLILPLTAPVEVRFSNEFTIARHNYSAMQLNLLYFLFSRLRSTPTDLVYQLALADLSLLTDKRYNSAHVQQEALALQSDGLQVRVDGNPVTIKLFESITYLEGKGIIEMTLSTESIPLLFNLHTRFTSVNLRAAFTLAGKYSKRVYALCEQWRDKEKTPLYAVEYFKWMLALTDSPTEQRPQKYAQFGHLNARVLTAAINEINKHTDLFIGLEVVKSGQLVTKIRFAISDKGSAARPAPAPLDPNLPPNITQAQLELAASKLDDYGILRADYREAILTSTKLIQMTLKFSHTIQIGVTKAQRPAGLLLTMMGLVAKKNRSSKSSVVA